SSAVVPQEEPGSRSTQVKPLSQVSHSLHSLSLGMQVPALHVPQPAPHSDSTSVQVPSLPATSQRSQLPAQAVSQHTPSTQWPVWQSLPEPQAEPGAPLQTPPLQMHPSVPQLPAEPAASEASHRFGAVSSMSLMMATHEVLVPSSWHSKHVLQAVPAPLLHWPSASHLPEIPVSPWHQAQSRPSVLQVASWPLQVLTPT